MKKKRFFTLLLLLLCAFPPILAQQYSTTNKKAIALYEEGIKAFQMNEWEKAEVNFLMALKKRSFYGRAVYLSWRYVYLEK